MSLSILFHPEADPVALDDVTNYQVFSCPQWKSPNLDLMSEASKQRFAVMYHQPLEESSAIQTLERAYVQGALSGVKVVAVYKVNLKIFLGSEVESRSFPAIERLWDDVLRVDWNQRLLADFDNEHEVRSGHSDYPFWIGVKDILDSNTLGLESYEILSFKDWPDSLVIDFDSLAADLDRINKIVASLSGQSEKMMRHYQITPEMVHPLPEQFLRCTCNYYVPEEVQLSLSRTLPKCGLAVLRIPGSADKPSS